MAVRKSFGIKVTDKSADENKEKLGIGLADTLQRVKSKKQCAIAK